MTLNKPDKALKNSKKDKPLLLKNTVLIIIFLIGFLLIIVLMATLWFQINKQKDIHEEITSRIIKEIHEEFESDYFK